MTYCFRCRNCRTPFVADTRNPEMPYCCDEPDLGRDYRAEGVGIAVAGLKREREHSKEEYAAKFLPSNSDFAGPTDPEGKKGMAKWREEHTPSDSNTRPYWPGEVEKTTF